MFDQLLDQEKSMWAFVIPFCRNPQGATLKKMKDIYHIPFSEYNFYYFRPVSHQP